MDDDPLAIPLILDAGTFNLKAGLNKSDTPTLCLQTIIGTIFGIAPDLAHFNRKDGCAIGSRAVLGVYQIGMCDG